MSYINFNRAESIRRTIATACAAALVLATSAFGLMAVLPALAGAHTTVSPTEATADGYAKLTFTVPHGCDGAATNRLIVQIPDGVSSVTPEMVPGWEIETTIGPLAEPIESHGEQITEGVREVSWTGGPLPDEYFQDFGLSVKFDGQPGETLYFNAVQECEGGGEAAWIQEPAEGEDPHDLEMPAPAVSLIAASDGGHGSDDAAEGDTAGESTSGTAAESDDGVNYSTVSVVALIVGAVGLATGAAALIRSRR